MGSHGQARVCLHLVWSNDRASQYFVAVPPEGRILGCNEKRSRDAAFGLPRSGRGRV